MEKPKGFTSDDAAIHQADNDKAKNGGKQKDQCRTHDKVNEMSSQWFDEWPSTQENLQNSGKVEIID
jgi:hypothetical protein